MSLEDLAMKHPAAIGPIAQGMKELSGRLEAAHRQMTEGIVKALEIATKGNLDPRDVEMQLTQAMRARAGRDLMVALTTHLPRCARAARTCSAPPAGRPTTRHREGRHDRRLSRRFSL
jgi:uncharacterized protein with von Willebrand factor type A (vWA) domain